MKKLLTELLEQLELDGKDYKTKSFRSIQQAIKKELKKPDLQPAGFLIETNVYTKYYHEEDRLLFERDLEINGYPKFHYLFSHKKISIPE